MHVPVHDRMHTPVGTHLKRAAALVCHVGRAFILFVSTFSKKFPSVVASFCDLTCTFELWTGTCLASTEAADSSHVRLQISAQGLILAISHG